MKLCFGTVQLGLKYGIQGNIKPDYNTAIKMLYSAYSNGIFTYDTAAIYGDAELILGDFIDRYSIPPNKIKIISKLSPKAFDNLREDSYNDIVIREVELTLKRLKVDLLDGYMFHSADHAFNIKAYNAIQEIKKKGYVNKVGVSVYTPEQAHQTINYDYDIIQLPYNILDKRLDTSDFFKKAKKKKMTIFARSALLQGLLLLKPEEIPKHMDFTKKVVSEFQEVCCKHCIDPFVAAVQYVLDKKEIDHLVFGVDNLEQLKEYVELTEKRDEELMLTLRQMWQKVDERILMPNLWNK